MKMLVVEDEADVEPMFLQRFRKEIRNNELEFAFALSGFEALKYLEQHNEDTHLIMPTSFLAVAALPDKIANNSVWRLRQGMMRVSILGPCPIQKA